MNIYKIVLTGGPCAGKTTIIEKMKKELSKDYYIVVVPETATELINSGILPDNGRNHTLKFQEIVLWSQILKERNAEEYCENLKQNKSKFLKNKKGIILLYDRGIMDNRAYLSHQDYNNLLENNGLNELETMDRYDLVIDLVSTATTKPEMYGLNGIRYETIEEASQKDELTSGAWLLHRNLKLIKPTETIQEKTQIVLNHVYDLLNNNFQTQMLELEIDEENTDLSFCNDDNSRIMKVKIFNLETHNGEHLIIEKKQYNGSISFLMKRVDANDTQVVDIFPIDYLGCLEMLTNSFVRGVLEFDVLRFVNKGNLFTLIKNSDSSILRVNPENVSEIPNNIVLKKQKTFTK